MTSNRPSTTGVQMSSKAMIVGFALVATGGLISMCGIGITGTVLVNTVRRWVRAQQEPPAAVMKRKIAQARAATAAATAAGSSAWQNGMATSRTR